MANFQYVIISGYGMYAVRWESFTDNSLSYRLLVSRGAGRSTRATNGLCLPGGPPKAVAAGTQPEGKAGAYYQE